MRLDGGLAQICGAGTLPAFRGRGMQKALLGRRLADAHAAAATWQSPRHRDHGRRIT
jgi:ribosomal protein S18 acetylase RimI-like enzyme